MNNTSVLVTSVSKTKPLGSNQSSFLPLTVKNDFLLNLLFSWKL